jgi:hypothetical protein
LFEQTVNNDLLVDRCGVLPSDIRDADKTEKMREIDAQLLGLFVTRAAISDVTSDEFCDFMDNHVSALQRYSDEHQVDLDERIGKAAARYRWV